MSIPKFPEREVYRMVEFDKTKCYEFTLYTRREGMFPNERWFTKNDMLYVGYHVRSERWGFGDGSGGAEFFLGENSKETRIEYDYAGHTCFRVVPPRN